MDDVTNDVAIRTPQVNVTIDRDKAGAMGVNANLIENALYDAYGPRWVSTIYGSVNEYKVLLELEPRYQADPRALSLLYFKNSTGKLIPLDTLASFPDRHRAADRQPLRTDPGGHHLLQPETRSGLGQRGR